MERQGLPGCRKRPLNSMFRCLRAMKSIPTQQQQQARVMCQYMRGMWSRGLLQGQMQKQVQTSLRRTVLLRLLAQPASQGQECTAWIC